MKKKKNWKKILQPIRENKIKQQQQQTYTKTEKSKLYKDTLLRGTMLTDKNGF